MSTKCKLFYIVTIFIIFPNFSSSTPTSTISDINEITTTELPPSFNELSPEIVSKSLNSFYQMNLTTTGAYDANFENKNSKVFEEFSSNIDAELIYVLESAFENQTIALGAFQVTKTLPSNLENHLYLTMLVNVSDDEAEKWKNVIKKRIEENGKLVDISVKMQGFGWAKLGESEEEICCCDSEFCSDSPTTEQVSSPSNSPDFNQCSPKETINHGKTSIFIFDSQNCVHQAQNELKSSGMCSSAKQGTRNEIKSAVNEDMEEGASNFQSNCAKVNEKPGEDVEQTVVVVKRKGNKIFIEI